ncbi:MAG: hypothetical protein EP329_24865 [Deltaproteobacteria bacterium]|nr:MAG: hypothetical protein EP329_24865 [Deltaproteobacteria bacterium]
MARLHHVVERSYVLDGASLGLAFALEQASRVLGLPLPSDLATSARIDAWGAVSAIDELAFKATTIAKQAPFVRRLLVAADQEDGCTEASALGLEVIPVKRVADALDVAFPDLADGLVGVDGIHETRADRVEAFYRLALSERSEMVDWTPVARAAEALLDTWDESLNGSERHLLRFTLAVAHRHQGQRVPLDLPDESWLNAQPSPLRQRHVAQLVQHAADTGSPSPEAARALAGRYVPANPQDRFPEHLEILGALARLDAVTGRPEAALRSQLDLARALLARGRVASTSFQLSEAFRLAGALGDERSYDEALHLLDEAERLGDVDAGGGRVYVDVARGRAEVLLGRLEEADERLTAIGRVVGAPFHVLGAALRWRIAARPAEPSTLRAELDVLGAKARSALSARRLTLLVALDDAARAGDRAAADAALAGLTELEPEPLDQLRRTRDAARWPEAADYVRRFYPY